MNSVLNEDIDTIIRSNLIEWDKLRNKNILITGATGLICSIIVKALSRKNEMDNLNISMYLVVRNIDKAKKIFGNNEHIYYIESNVEEFNEKGLNINYIIHGASPTKSKYFIEKPVETMDTILNGTKNLLEVAKQNNIESMVYLSSMEMYGTIESDHVTEDMLGYINPLDARSSYSEGKRTSELYCFSYYKEYDIPVKIARIAQTFGAGIALDESRVYKAFADAVLDKKNIVLKSDGTTIINYSYTTDTVIGIIYILLNGESGEAYNLVGDKTNMTVLDSAKWLAKKFCNNEIEVQIDLPKENCGFAPSNKMVLNNEKLKKLGWTSQYNIKQGYERLIKYLIEERDKQV